MPVARSNALPREDAELCVALDDGRRNLRGVLLDGVPQIVQDALLVRDGVAVQGVEDLVPVANEVDELLRRVDQAACMIERLHHV